MSILPFWIVNLKFNPEDEDYVSLKRWCLSTSSHGVTTHKTTIDLSAGARTSNIKLFAS
jgi:hypothetical protein